MLRPPRRRVGPPLAGCLNSSAMARQSQGGGRAPPGAVWQTLLWQGRGVLPLPRAPHPKTTSTPTTPHSNDSDDVGDRPPLESLLESGDSEDSVESGCDDSEEDDEE